MLTVSGVLARWLPGNRVQQRPGLAVVKFNIIGMIEDGVCEYLKSLDKASLDEREVGMH